MPRSHHVDTPHKQEISRLKRELDEARQDILGLMPREIEEKMGRLIHVKTETVTECGSVASLIL
jgi:hypothetical protein